MYMASAGQISSHVPQPQHFSISKTGGIFFSPNRLVHRYLSTVIESPQVDTALFINVSRNSFKRTGEFIPFLLNNHETAPPGVVRVWKVQPVVVGLVSAFRAEKGCLGHDFAN